MEKIFNIVFAVILLFGTANVTAEPLNDFETLLLQEFLTDESSRPAVRIAFWADIDRQIKEANKNLPGTISEGVSMVNLSYDGKTTVTFNIVVIDKDIDFNFVQENIIPLLCQDPQTALFLTIFEGTFIYNHYLYKDLVKPLHSFAVNNSDCGTGI